MQRRGRVVGLVVVALAVAGVAAAVVMRGSSSSAAVSQAATPTWNNVAPIFAAKCAGCHMKGGIAPFSITSPQSAKSHAAQIRIMTQLGLMPPWPPAADSPAYLGSSRRILTAREKDLIARWARGGAPRRSDPGDRSRPHWSGRRLRVAGSRWRRLVRTRPTLPSAGSTTTTASCSSRG